MPRPNKMATINKANQISNTLVKGRTSIAEINLATISSNHSSIIEHRRAAAQRNQNNKNWKWSPSMIILDSV
jgi:hypothetical protein